MILTKLYPFQKEGVEFLEKREGRALLGHDMGLGKSLMSIAWLDAHPKERPAIIVCPASVKFHWERECWQHARLETEILNSRTPSNLSKDILILNYDILDAWIPHLLQQKPKVLIMDETHYCKNRRAKRTKACQQIAKHCKHILALSGTPITNRPIEFFTILNMVAPDKFRSFWKYAFRYCDPKRGFQGRGWDFTGASNLDELHRRASEIMIRRMKSEVLKDLPPKIRTILPIEIDNFDDYQEAARDFLTWLHSKEGRGAVARAKGALALVRLGKLKQIAAQGKLKSLIEWIDSFLKDTNEKLVVFGIHKKILHKLKNHYPNSVLIDGSVFSVERQKRIDKFQNDNSCRLFFGNIHTAGIGLTLTAASTVLFAELAWTPGEMAQPEDRVLRIGQEASVVNVVYMIGHDTIEEKILEMIQSKHDVVKVVLDGKLEDWF